MQKIDNATKAIVLLLIGVAFWGMTFSVMKEALGSIDAFSFIFIRFLIAGIILTIIFSKELRNCSFETIKVGIFIGIILSAVFLFQVVGLDYTTASNAGFINGLYTILTLIFVCILDRKLPSKILIFSILLAFIGLALISINEELTVGIGDALIFLCAVATAFHVIFINRVAIKVNAAAFSITQYFVVAIIGLIVGLATNGTVTVPSEVSVWWAILFCAIFATAYTYTAQTYLQKYIGEIKASVIYSMEAVFAAIFAVIYLGESLTTNVLIGGSLIVIAVIISIVKK